MKRFYMKDHTQASRVRWEGLAAAGGMGAASLLLFFIGLPLWAVVIAQIIGSYLLYLFLKVAFARGRDTS
ncbi:MAG TPA: hypothetical protein VKA70_16705 [Blastocatellia bacterium]|nr:hypothetical protein [Blastocatellia bacterium]